MKQFYEIVLELRKELANEIIKFVENELVSFARIQPDLLSVYLQFDEIDFNNDLLAEFSGLFLWWYSFISINLEHKPQISDRSIRLMVLCNRFGAFDLAINIGDRYLHEIDNFNIIESNSLQWHMLLTYAKCLRRKGKYQAAFEQYLRLAEKIKPTDIEAHAHLLLNMGKAAHNHQWRAGYSRCLISFAAKRFKKLLNQEVTESDKYKEFARLFAICLDSQALIDYEVRKHSFECGWNSKLPNQLSETWHKALKYANKSGIANTELRIICRYSYTKFHLSNDYKKKDTALTQFYEAVERLENSPFEQRGLAVRYGQYAEMLSQLYPEREDKIKYYIKESIQLAGKLNDWRTQATNRLRLSKIYFDAKYYSPDLSIGELHAALRELKENLEEQLPELEVYINREIARQLRLNGDYQKSEEFLKKAQLIIVNLEERLHSDLERDRHQKYSNNFTNGNKSTCYAPTWLLTSSETYEVREALFLDFQLHSELLHKVANDRLSTADLAATQATTQHQLAFLQDFIRGQAHSFKGFIEEFRAMLERVLQEETENDCTIQVLINKSQKKIELVEKKFHELTLNYKLSPINKISINGIFIKIINDLIETNRFENVKFNQPEPIENTSNFYIICCKEIFQMVIENLLINAARAAFNYSTTDCSMVTTRIGWFSSDDGYSTFGLIEIIDTGGQVENLKHALGVAKCEKDRNIGEKQTFGLPHAITFLSAFNADVSVDGEEGVNTILKIRLPVSSRILYE